ncbi:MAG: YdcF family protein [Oscillospiraceae bacterium]|nr:YdcF family protein [Oscillospiraceae bacterium]
MKRKIYRLLLVLLCLGVLGVAAVLILNGMVCAVGKAQMLSLEAAATVDADCIIVLGCQVKESGEMSHMLHDRVQRGVELYKAGAAPKIIMSGDHGREEYNEVGAMKNYATENGVPSTDVFMDHAGFSTYETVYRAKEIFGAKKVIIVTQEYHLYRAVYIAQQLGMEAYGVAADYRTYAGQLGRDAREILARCKDVAMTVFRPKPTYLGDPIPLTGSGDVTNDGTDG